MNKRKEPTAKEISRMPVKKRLVYECETMLSRVRAILAVPEAVDALCAYDIFGDGYEELLRADARSLRKAIQMAKGKA